MSDTYHAVIAADRAAASDLPLCEEWAALSVRERKAFDSFTDFAAAVMYRRATKSTRRAGITDDER